LFGAIPGEGYGEVAEPERFTLFLELLQLTVLTAAFDGDTPFGHHDHALGTIQSAGRNPGQFSIW
jgi:hypothetical protein